MEAACRSRFGDAGGFLRVAAPGRVNLLGDHTDYTGGLVLPVTLDRAVYQAQRARRDGRVKLYCLNRKEGLEFESGRIPEQEPGSWGSYVVGVIAEFRSLTAVDGGLELAFYGDVPVGAGLASSAALTVATALGLDHICGTDLPERDIALLCQRVEHRYAGVQCGIMDQYVAAAGRRGHCLLLDCADLSHRHIPLDLARCNIVIAHSGVSRGLADSHYNARRRQCEWGLSILKANQPAIDTLRDVSADMLDHCREQLGDSVYRRCLHVVEENRRVLQGAAALEAGALDDFGALMYASHESLRKLYEVSCAQLDTLVELCRQAEGVLGARMTGAGFGGCVVALVAPGAAPGLEQWIASAYPALSGCEAQVFRLRDNLQAGCFPPG